MLDSQSQATNDGGPIGAKDGSFDVTVGGWIYTGFKFGDFLGHASTKGLSGA